MRQFVYWLEGRLGMVHRQTCDDCWRHFGDGWRGGALDFLVATSIWNYVINLERRTTYTIREGLFDERLYPRVEGAGGVLCLQCFDLRARILGIEYRESLVVFGSDSWMGAHYNDQMPL